MNDYQNETQLTDEQIAALMAKLHAEDTTHDGSGEAAPEETEVFVGEDTADHVVSIN